MFATRDGLQSTSREASIVAFLCSPHWEELWPTHEARGYKCVPLTFTRRTEGE